MSGRRPPRNADYNPALTVLLTRLSILNAVLVDALVDSRHTEDLGLPEVDRRLIQAPIRLGCCPRRSRTAPQRTAAGLRSNAQPVTYPRPVMPEARTCGLAWSGGIYMASCSV